MIDGIFRLVSFFIGFVYPSYASMKAIDTKTTEDDTQWLMYWVIYSLALVFESFADMFVFWVPGYRLAKLAGVYWLVSPRFKGASVLYKKLLAPHVKHAMPVVDKLIGDVMKGDFRGVKEEVVPRVQQAHQYVAKHAPEMWEKTMKMAADTMKKSQEKKA